MLRKSSSSVRIFYPKSNREIIIKTLKGRMEALQSVLPISRVILFGSYARDNFTVRSDIDLLIICKTELNDAFERAKKAIAISGVQPHIYTESEYLEMKETIDRMIHGGIVLFEE